MRRALHIFESKLGCEHPNVAIQPNSLAALLKATNRLTEAEPLMRRALAIDENGLDRDHPQVAIHLNGLAGLLQDTSRLEEAEPLMRRAVEIFLKFTHSTGYPHPSLHAAANNYRGLLQAMGRSGEEIRSTMEELGRPFGTNLGGAGHVPPPKLRAVLEQLMRDPSKLRDIASKLQQEDPALFMEVWQWIQSEREGTNHTE